MQTPMEPNSTPPVYSYTYTKPLIAGERRDLILAAVLLIAAILSVNFSLFGSFHSGFAVSIPILTGCAIVYLKKQVNGAGAFAWFCLIASLLGCGVFVWHNDRTIHFLCFVGIVFLSMLALADATEKTPHDTKTIAVIADVFDMWLARPLTHMATALKSVFYRSADGQTQRRRCGGVLIGCLCAIPALSVLLPLLIRSDMAFEGLMQYTVLDNLGEILVSLIGGIALFCVIYARLFSIRRIPDAPTYKSQKTFAGVDPMAVNTFLGVISALYIVYMAAQFAYFFDAFSGILPESYTVAEYARRGFFEMCAVCAINLLLIAGSLLLCRKAEDAVPPATRLLCLFILLFSLGMNAVAIAKMVLYIRSFGMTRLRILTSAFMLALSIVLIAVGIRMFVKKFPYMRMSIIAVALIGLAVAYADVDTVVARYNVTGYQNGTLTELDEETLTELSDGATPYLLQLYENGEPSDTVTVALCEKLMESGVNNEDGKINDSARRDLRSYNIDSHRTKTLLLPHARELFDRWEKIMNTSEE